MPSEYIPQATRRLVQARANGYCEYCCSPDDYGTAGFVVEHIRPRAAGGLTVLSNLAWGCVGCNGHKSAKITAIDPVTQERVALFNPRSQEWCEHFRWAEDDPTKVDFRRTWLSSIHWGILIERRIMLDKLFGKKQPTQSQTIGNITTNGGQVQVAQAGGDLAQAQSGENAGQQQGLTGAEVVEKLEQLIAAIEASALTSEQKESLQDYLKPTKREAGKEQPDKELMGKNLKNVSETMKNLKETTEAGKSVWATGVEVFKAIGPWVGLAAGFWG